jgi:hypothetical protein
MRKILRGCFIPISKKAAFFTFKRLYWLSQSYKLKLLGSIYFTTFKNAPFSIGCLRSCLSYYYSCKSFLFSRVKLKFSQRIHVYVSKIKV